MVFISCSFTWTHYFYHSSVQFISFNFRNGTNKNPTISIHRMFQFLSLLCAADFAANKKKQDNHIEWTENAQPKNIREMIAMFPTHIRVEYVNWLVGVDVDSFSLQNRFVHVPAGCVCVCHMSSHIITHMRKKGWKCELVIHYMIFDYFTRACVRAFICEIFQKLLIKSSDVSVYIHLINSRFKNYHTVMHKKNKAKKNQTQLNFNNISFHSFRCV